MSRPSQAKKTKGEETLYTRVEADLDWTLARLGDSFTVIAVHNAQENGLEYLEGESILQSRGSFFEINPAYEMKDSKSAVLIQRPAMPYSDQGKTSLGKITYKLADGNYIIQENQMYSLDGCQVEVHGDVDFHAPFPWKILDEGVSHAPNSDGTEARHSSVRLSLKHFPFSDFNGYPMGDNRNYWVSPAPWEDGPHHMTDHSIMRYTAKVSWLQPVPAEKPEEKPVKSWCIWPVD